MKTSVFTRHPLLTIFSIILIFLAFIMILSEVFLSIKLSAQDNTIPKSKFSISLREHGRNIIFKNTPSDKYLLNTDSLKKREYILRTDNLGFIGPSNKHPNPDFKIGFLGGSQLEAFNVPEKKRFAYLTGVNLESELSAKIETYNAGTGGSNSFQENFVFLSKFAPLKMDVVILMSSSNDFGVHLLYESYWNNSDTRGIIIKRPQVRFKDSGFKTRLKYIIRALFPNLTGEILKMLDQITKTSNSIIASTRNADQLEQERKRILSNVDNYLINFKNSLRTFVALARIWGSQPILTTEANRLTHTPDLVVKKVLEALTKKRGLKAEEYIKIIEKFNQAVRDVAKEKNVILIDLANVIPKTRKYLYDAWHFNEVGSEKVSEEFVKILIPILTNKNLNK